MTEQAIVVFGDVVESQLDSAAAARWLRSLAAELDDALGDRRRTRFGFTQGDELQGVLAPDADPLDVVFRAMLRETVGPAMRWAIAAGDVAPGEGPATEWTGRAFVQARELIGLARRRRDQLVVRSGDPASDALLDDVAPVLGRLLSELTDRQQVVGKLLLVDGLRQAEAAERLGIARPTVSVAAERARLREIARLRDAVTRLLRTGMAAASPPAPAGVTGGTPGTPAPSAGVAR